jgi:tRNA 2-selenouridine synthase SelU
MQHSLKIAHLQILDGKTPYELVNGMKPNLVNLSIWGENVYVKIISSDGKLGSKAKEAQWISYSTDSLGHQIYWKDRHAITIECNVKFISVNSQAPIIQFEEESRQKINSNDQKI